MTTNYYTDVFAHIKPYLKIGDKVYLTYGMVKEHQLYAPKCASYCFTICEIIAVDLLVIVNQLPNDINFWSSEHLRLLRDCPEYLKQ